MRHYFIIILLLFKVEISLIAASRGALFNVIGIFVFCYVMFYSYYRQSVKKKITKWFLLIFIGAAIGGGIITISRFKDSNISPFQSVISYFGEPFNHWGLKIWDNDNIKRTYGEIYYPSLYSFFNGTKEPKFETKLEVVQFWEWKSNEGLHNNLAPIYGKLYMEFGTLIPFLIIILTTILFRLYLKRNYLHVYQFPIIIFLFSSLYFFAVFGNGFREDSIKILFYTVLLSLFIKKLTIESK